MIRNYSPEWRTAYADNDILSGGLWIRDYGDYADVIEVTDLDSAAGTTNMVIVSVGSVGMYGRDLAENRRRIADARQSCGHEAGTRDNLRLRDWASLWECGTRDIESETIMATAKEWSGGRDAWKPTEHSYGVDGQFGKWIERVNDTKGLKRWLWRNHQLDVANA